MSTLTKKRFSKGIMKGFFYVPKDEMTDIERAKESLYMIPRGSEEGVPIYIETDKWFGFPRHWFRYPENLVQDFQDLRSDGQPIEFDMKAKLYDYQEPVFEEFIEAKEQGKTGFVLEADVAFGKTVTMLFLIHAIKRTTLVIVPSRGLIDQWVERILEHTTLKRNDIGFVNGRQCLWKGKSVVIALVNSIILPDYLGADFREYFGHVAWDEVHTTVPPKTFAEAGGQFAGRYRTGASATLDRFDGMDKVFEKHLEQVRIHGEDPDPVIPIVNVVNFKGSSGNIPSWVKGTNQRRGWLLKALGLNEERNRLLAQRIRKRYDEGYRPVVLSDRKRQLQVLNTMIRGGIPGKEIGLYVGSINGKKVDDEELTKIKKTARVILATPGMMKLGQDISSLDCMIYATPTADPRQSSGRIRRKKTGKQTPVIDDLVDEAYSETRRWWQRRRAFYRGAGFEIKGGGL